ncbi:hypothetical protein V1503_24945 [Bacillus sp. SCS-151]|uniref:phage tail protein n=1 Tax=Nanhaiella sioensis TaxID=3115293 RepID=UPI0039788EF5
MKQIAVVKNLMVRAGADFSKLRKDMYKAQKQVKSFKKNVNKTLAGIGATIASVGLGFYVKDAVNDAMRFEASIQQLNRLMGQSAGEFMKWAESTAYAFNMSKSDAVQYGATFSNIISTFANDTKQTQQYTQDLLQATAVAASMTGRSMEDALERVRSGMLGNTEAIEDLGIFVNVAMIESTKAFQEFANGKSWDQLDFRTQQTIRYFAILEQAATKYGVEVGNNTMSATAKLTARLGDLKLAMGQAFMPIWNYVLPALTAFVSKLVQVMNVVAQFTKALFGKSEQNAQAKATDQQAGAVSGLGDAYKEAGKKAKKAKNSLAGFDEINSLGNSSSAEDEDADSGGAGIPEEMPINFDTNATEIGEKIQEMANKTKQFFQDVKSLIVEHKDLIIASLAGIGGAITAYTVLLNGAKVPTKLWAVASKNLSKFFGALLSPIGLVALAIGSLVAAFVYFYRKNEKFRGVVDGIFNKIKDAALWLWKNVMVPFGTFLSEVFSKAWDVVKVASEKLWNKVLVPFGEFLATVFKNAWDTVKQAAEWAWKNVFVPLGDFLWWFWKDVLVPVGGILFDVLAIAFETVAEIAKSLWENVLVPLAEFFVSAFGPTLEAVSAVFTFLWEKILVPLGTFLGGVFKKAWEGLITVITWLWDNVLKPVAKYLAGAFADTFDTVFSGIGSIIKGLETTFEGLMTFITGVFTGDWEKAWEGVKGIFKGIFESLYGFVKTPLNLIIDAINTVIGALNSISIDIPDWVPKYGGQTFGISIPKIPKLARGGIVDTKTNMGNYIAGEAGKEMIVPLENTSFVDKIASALGTAVMNAMEFSNSSNSGQSGDLIFNVDGRTLARVMKPYLDQEKKRIGNDITLNPI